MRNKGKNMSNKISMSKKSNKKIYCPSCKLEIWDYAVGNKLHKCWNCNLAFDVGLTRNERK